MGYRLSWQKKNSSFSPYFLLFGHKMELPTSIRWNAMVIINVDDLNVWIHACKWQATLFWCVMPMAMESLAIAPTLKYIVLCHYKWRWLLVLEWGDYVYLQHTTLTTLDVTTRCVIMCERFCFLECCCWRAEMDKLGKTMCAIVHHVIFPIWMAKLTHS